MAHLITLVASLHILIIGSFLVLSGCQSHSNYPTIQDTIPVMAHVAPVRANDDAVAIVRATPTRPTWSTSSPTPVFAQPNDMPLEPVMLDLSMAEGTTYTVQKGDSLWSISKRYNMTVSTLAQANQLAKNAQLKIGQKLTIPGQSTIVGDEAVNTAATTYTVRPGDSLSKIAKRCRMTVAALKAANNLSSDTIRVGQTLVTTGTTSTAPIASSSTALPLNDAQEYTVRPGDTLSLIAARSGTRVKDLMAWNGIEDARALRAGQVLRLPNEASSSVQQVQTSSAVVIEDIEVMTVTPVDYSGSNQLPEGFGDDNLLDAADAATVVLVDQPDDLADVSSSESNE